MDEGFLNKAETMFLDAATDPDAWQAALEFVQRESGSRGAALLTVEGRGPFVLPTQDMGELAERYVRDGWYLRDFRYAGIPLMKQRGSFVDQDIVKREDRRKMAYYAEFLEPMGFGWFAGLKVSTGDDLWCLTLQRGDREGPYLAEDQASLRRLSSIVSRAAALARRLEFARLDGASDVAEAMNGPCLFIDRFGRVVRMNAAAEAMVGRKFQLRQGQIRFPGMSSETLDRHIQAAIWPELAPDSAAMLPIVIRQQDARPLIFQAIRLRGRSFGFFAPAFAMLTVTDLGERIAPDIELIQSVFPLTQAEARLALALDASFSLVEAAAFLNSTHETVRTQIKSIFAKTGTGNQIELVDLIGRFRPSFAKAAPE